MKEDRPPQSRSTVDRVRSLGFNPAQLTPRERDELIALYTTYPDDSRTIAAPRAGR